MSKIDNIKDNDRAEVMTSIGIVLHVLGSMNNPLSHEDRQFLIDSGNLMHEWGNGFSLWNDTAHRRMVDYLKSSSAEHETVEILRRLINEGTAQ
ncbi:MAG: hypothetical protein H7Z12_19940 [Rhodospirillaceae bacterium]|nr:hypothetical protein [Rhodospirillales bacterium]